MWAVVLTRDRVDWAMAGLIESILAYETWMESVLRLRVGRAIGGCQCQSVVLIAVSDATH